MRYNFPTMGQLHAAQSFCHFCIANVNRESFLPEGREKIKHSRSPISEYILSFSIKTGTSSILGSQVTAGYRLVKKGAR